ncbi:MULTISPECIES: right-handed parallel beta-helix repeat-containing protein [unclassified Sphingomonas]|uniref:right-handed parallel beta-helix repeat-containing protein n=1 Tax=unclassified Sphingomonas TaxID=196159 RepID=UPI00226A7E85|nr:MULTISPECIES: right-handed parallel beta-helix repeat-containing protein [unclassified Sphingomonas]
METDRRFVLGAALTLACPRSAVAAPVRIFTPEEFGAKGDGRTNDSLAFGRLANAVNMYGGGTVSFRKTTYLVGLQGLAPNDFYLFPPRDLLTFKGCHSPLLLEGNGARILCETGLRFGVFGLDGLPSHHPMPYTGPGLASPYKAMISVENCTAAVQVSDFDLEGCTDDLIIGGQYGDVGWQIPAYGLLLRDNLGSEVIERIRSHSHPLDGIGIIGPDKPTAAAVRTLIDVIADRNGRQGCSLTSGHDYAFKRCNFTRTGRGKISSAPGAGIDIEAEDRLIRHISFEDCHFADNAGCGMVADSGDSADIRFDRCVFVGTTSWSAWPRKPGMRFIACKFVGAIANAFGNPDPSRAAQFYRCTFDNNPALSSTGKVYGGSNTDRPLADLSSEINVLFDQCKFSALHRGSLPWSTGAIYRDCTMVAGFDITSHTRGHFLGYNTIVGKVDLSGSKIVGAVMLNGKLLH